VSLRQGLLLKSGPCGDHPATKYLVPSDGVLIIDERVKCRVIVAIQLGMVEPATKTSQEHVNEGMNTITDDNQMTRQP
jgi:hypothetical protein